MESYKIFKTYNQSIYDACGEPDDHIHIVGLYLGLVGGLIAYRDPAFLASVDKHVASLGVRLRLDGTEDAAAGVGPVAGVDINVERAEAEGAVVTGGVAQGQVVSIQPTLRRTLLLQSSTRFRSTRSTLAI